MMIRVSSVAVKDVVVDAVGVLYTDVKEVVDDLGPQPSQSPESLRKAAAEREGGGWSSCVTMEGGVSTATKSCA
jgi:hypothetical protein